MVCFTIADQTLVGNIVETKGSKTVIKVGRVLYTVPTVNISPFIYKKNNSN